MAATKYQVMYRFMNDTLGTPITNNSDTEYEPLFEFYTDPDHRIFSPDAEIQNEEMEKQQGIITESNSVDNSKHDMLFVFNGTKKVLHKKWVDEQTGYIVRDWQSVRSLIGNRDDWSKDFYTLGGMTPEDGGLVVAPLHTFEKYYKPYSLAGGNYASSTVEKEFIESTIFMLSISDWKQHTTDSKVTAISENYNYGSESYRVATGPIFVDVPDGTIRMYSGYVPDVYHRTVSAMGIRNDSSYYNNCYNTITHKMSDIQTTTIPGHYEDTPESPYAIKDQYKRIESSPWIINCTVGSLEAALTKARILVDMIGIENVKIIKVVPFDQYIKIP